MLVNLKCYCQLNSGHVKQYFVAIQLKIPYSWN